MKEITLEEAKEVIELYSDEEKFLSVAFQRWTGMDNEYFDNSIELDGYYAKCLKILNKNKIK